MNKNALIRTCGIIMLIALIIATGVIILTSWNPMILHGLVDDFEKEIESADGIEIIETQSAYGKLNGNGNGFNYFGGALVKTENSETLDALIETLKSEFDDAGYYKQEGSEIDVRYLERPRLSYESEIEDGCYTVWFYRDSHPYTNPLDPNGH